MYERQGYNMTPTGEKDRAAVVCQDCDNIYVVRITEDETIEPIGIPDDCQECGGSNFKILGDQVSVRSDSTTLD